MSTTSPNLIIIPTFNEKENVSRIVPQVIDYDCDLLFVDDNSPDGTAQTIEDLIKQRPKISIIKRPGKMGLRSAYVQGFEHALKAGYNRIITMDCDLSHTPAKIPEMLNTDADVVVGSRYIPGGNITGWPWYRYFLSKGANVYAYALLNAPIKELTGGFNCYKREVLQSIDMHTLKSEGYAFVIELKCRSWRAGFKLCEIPITFKERERGQSKISKHIIWEAFWLVLKLALIK